MGTKSMHKPCKAIPGSAVTQNTGKTILRMARLKALDTSFLSS